MSKKSGLLARILGAGRSKMPVVMATTVRRIKQEMKIRRSLSMTPSKLSGGQTRTPRDATVGGRTFKGPVTTVPLLNLHSYAEERGRRVDKPKRATRRKEGGSTRAKRVKVPRAANER